MTPGEKKAWAGCKCQNLGRMCGRSRKRPMPTAREAAEYCNIGIKKIDSMLRTPNYAFVIYVSTKKLVKRKNLSSLSACDLLFCSLLQFNV